MNVRLSMGRVVNTKRGMRTIGWCMVFLGMAGASWTRSAVAAESTAATRTTLTAATESKGPRTRATLTAHVEAPNEGVAPSGVVTFRAEQSGRGSDASSDLGSAFLDSEGNATLQTDNLPAGNHEVVAVYQGHETFVASTSNVQQVHANDASTVPGFTVAASPTSLNATVGGFASSVVTVTPNNGFNSYVSLTCSGLPINTTCSFTPVSVPASCTTGIGGAQTCTPGTSVMQIQTLSPTKTGSLRGGEDAGMPSYVFVFPLLFGLAGLGARNRRGLRNLALGMLAFTCIVGMTSCAQRYNYLNHGPPPNTGSPAGNYTVTIEAQSSTGANTTVPPTLPQITLVISAAKN